MLKKIIRFVINGVHLVLLCGLGVLVFRAVAQIKTMDDFFAMCSKIGINEIFTFIGAIAFILFGVVGMYEYAYLNGIDFIVPPSYKNFKQKNELKQVEKMMEVYYERDIRYTQEYEKERAQFLIQALGIEEKQYRHINYEIIKARTMSDKCIYGLKCKAQKALFHKEFIVDQSKTKASQRMYDKVDYFINMYTALYDDEMCKMVADIMARYLVLDLEERITNIDYIIIPQGGNFLLGLEVGKRLNKPVISILDKERIYKDIYWDGVYVKNDKEKNNIIVLHDVLVTGKRLYDSVKKLPKDSYNLVGIYNLFRYNNNDFDPFSDIKDAEMACGIEEKKVKWLLEVNEDILKSVYEGTYEWETI